MSNWEVVIFKWSTAREKERMRQEETFRRTEEETIHRHHSLAMSASVSIAICYN